MHKKSNKEKYHISIALLWCSLRPAHTAAITLVCKPTIFPIRAIFVFDWMPLCLPNYRVTPSLVCSHQLLFSPSTHPLVLKKIMCSKLFFLLSFLPSCPPFWLILSYILSPDRSRKRQICPQLLLLLYRYFLNFLPSGTPFLCFVVLFPLTSIIQVCFFPCLCFDPAPMQFFFFQESWENCKNNTIHP